MTSKIILEEHFATADTVDICQSSAPAEYWPVLRERLLDFHEERLRQMDRHNIEYMIMSANQPLVQNEQTVKKASDLAIRLNDFLAEQILKEPKRFKGFAVLPLQDPDAAILELERCVTDLNFVGTMINGYSGIQTVSEPIYYDAPRYRPFFSRMQDLGVPFYLHPRNPSLQNSGIYTHHEWLLGPTWAFGQETAVHALRLIGSGLFDDFPKLNLILGHLGEGIPSCLWRIDNQNRWLWNGIKRSSAKKTVTEYFKENVYITTSGNFHALTLNYLVDLLGDDRIMFSVDWPYEEISDGVFWFDSLPLDSARRNNIARENAARVFNII